MVHKPSKDEVFSTFATVKELSSQMQGIGFQLSNGQHFTIASMMVAGWVAVLYWNPKRLEYCSVDMCRGSVSITDFIVMDEL